MKKSEITEEQQLTNKLIELHKKKIEELTEQERTIEDRYKKMMNEELSDIVREKTRRLSIIESLSNPSAESTAEQVKEKAPVEEKKEEAEPTIQDTLFPENNEPESKDEQVVESQTDPLNTNDIASVSEVTSPVNDTQVIDESKSDADSFMFDDDKSADTETKDESDDEDWPDMPQEWQ